MISVSQGLGQQTVCPLSARLEEPDNDAEIPNSNIMHFLRLLLFFELKTVNRFILTKNNELLNKKYQIVQKSKLKNKLKFYYSIDPAVLLSMTG